MTFPSTGCPSKIDDKMIRKLVREAAKRPTAALKEMQEFLASTGCVLYVTKFSCLGYVVGCKEKHPPRLVKFSKITL